MKPQIRHDLLILFEIDSHFRYCYKCYYYPTCTGHSSRYRKSITRPTKDCIVTVRSKWRENCCVATSRIVISCQTLQPIKQVGVTLWYNIIWCWHLKWSTRASIREKFVTLHATIVGKHALIEYSAALMWLLWYSWLVATFDSCVSLSEDIG